MKKESATIRKIAAAWDRKLWGFYDLQTKEIKKTRELERLDSPFFMARKKSK